MACRAIIHLRLNGFFARVEQMATPELAGKPVMVAAWLSNRSVVISVSPEAAARGVTEGMSARHANRLCPAGVFVPPKHAEYADVFAKILDISASYTPWWSRSRRTGHFWT
jgi:DNA polymerase IV